MKRHKGFCLLIGNSMMHWHVTITKGPKTAMLRGSKISPLNSKKSPYEFSPRFLWSLVFTRSQRITMITMLYLNLYNIILQEWWYFVHKTRREIIYRTASLSKLVRMETATDFYKPAFSFVPACFQQWIRFQLHQFFPLYQVFIIKPLLSDKDPRLASEFKLLKTASTQAYCVWAWGHN